VLEKGQCPAWAKVPALVPTLTISVLAACKIGAALAAQFPRRPFFHIQWRTVAAQIENSRLSLLSANAPPASTLSIFRFYPRFFP
jgi:hypothetical protein